MTPHNSQVLLYFCKEKEGLDPRLFDVGLVDSSLTHIGFVESAVKSPSQILNLN